MPTGKSSPSHSSQTHRALAPTGWQGHTGDLQGRSPELQRMLGHHTSRYQPLCVTNLPLRLSPLPSRDSYSNTCFGKNSYRNRSLEQGRHFRPPFLLLWFPNWHLHVSQKTKVHLRPGSHQSCGLWREGESRQLPAGAAASWGAGSSSGPKEPPHSDASGPSPAHGLERRRTVPHCRPR